MIWSETFNVDVSYKQWSAGDLKEVIHKNNDSRKLDRRLAPGSCRPHVSVVLIISTKSTIWFWTRIVLPKNSQSSAADCLLDRHLIDISQQNYQERFDTPKSWFSYRSPHEMLKLWFIVGKKWYWNETKQHHDFEIIRHLTAGSAHEWHSTTTETLVP